MLFVAFEFLLLDRFKRPHALEHLININKMTVKLRTVNTDELGLSAYCQTASAAHTCAVNHNCVKRHICGYVVFLCQKTTELHHYSRSDGKNLINLFTFDDILYSDSHNTFVSVGTVICHYDCFITVCTYLVFKYDKFLCSSCKDRDNTITRSF